MLQKIATAAIGVAALLLGPPTGAAVPPPDGQSCSERTTATYHSPKCGWGYVVDDPGRLENISISHDPPYHTYSRWVIRGRAYIFAYRDVGNRPDDMRVDIYRERDQNRIAATIAITGLETHVFSTNMTGPDSSDIVFRYLGGELQYVTIMRFTDDSIKDVFDCVASSIDISPWPKSKIVARYRISNIVKEFVWGSASDSFVKTAEFPWRSSR